ncbi:hypothetical protein SAMD00019534_112840 [Acytostelium subglobosum LB1]|uniref:hypothetical protein n=1 Tax=Acytostelium subglobosum LB1 TaxID=1410327 RepID=UPI000644CD96|nr:hypothetical protein SAMD00019534_112840 [Acytostelium subglobosum LB1]GAM28108.1 hypothetical protein SAMD00019534_112840 [Acytostelium subglobosum LB1]|eukprot:XP_012749067.1 hypothetical protein SAMD00019534_112840 [Acytostelium subglobosum LB1]
MIAVAVTAGVLMVIAIIVGATGPRVYDSQSYSAYNCQNGSHVWSPPPACIGFQPSQPGAIWIQEIDGITQLTRFWAVQLTPYSNNLVNNTIYNLQLSVQIYGGESSLLTNTTTTMLIECPAGNGACTTFTLIDQQVLENEFYIVQVSLLNPNDNIIGDIVYSVWRAHEKFSSFEIAIHLTYMVLSSGLVIFYLYAMRTLSLSLWTFEQKFLFILLIALVLSNNPFFGFQYIVSGWFFPFLNSVFSIVFLCVFSLYSMTILDKMRLEYTQPGMGPGYILKLAVIGTFGALGIALFTWINLRDRKDPVLGPALAVNGIQVLFYFVSTIFIAILLWISMLVVITAPIVSGKRYLIPKFVFTSAPISIYVFSVIIGIFAGTFGPLNPTALSVMYFNTLNNVFTALIAYSYWPKITGNQQQAVTGNEEEQRLFGDDSQL